ncbi:hypothetical protein, partial [Parabacteroides johnsonii]|uniref:hypothetical protein n=1 Tax=Parabacteroides johnsonii TaxID=387661 RepID=UPI003F1F33D1
CKSGSEASTRKPTTETWQGAGCLAYPQLAEQTILLCTTSEIRTDSDYIKLEPFISKTYTLHRNVEAQNTTVEDGYFGLTLNQ